MSNAFGAGRMRLVAFGVLVATFVVGALAGAAADRVLNADETPKADQRDDRGDGRERHHLLDDLDLSVDQRAAVDTILERRSERMRAVWAEAGPRFEAIADSTRAEIMQVLTPDQRERYTAELERRRQRREKEAAERNADRPDRGHDDDAKKDTTAGSTG